jgi:hypothetical protein
MNSSPYPFWVSFSHWFPNIGFISMKSGHIRAFNNASRTVRMDFPSTNLESFDPFHSWEDFTTAIREYPLPFKLIFLTDE